MADGYSILVVDDEPAIVRLLCRELSGATHVVFSASTAAEALAHAHSRSFDVAIVDICLPDGRGTDLMQTLRSLQPEMEVICVTGHGSIGDAVEAMRLGAYDYVTKPFNLDELELVVERAYQKSSLRLENRRLRYAKMASGDVVVGMSPAMRKIMYLAERVAPTDVPVLLMGPSGAGKEVMAHAIQRRSHRRDMQFVIKNCATLSRELANSELFGHVRGAFTGALHNHGGLMVEAHKGTLFLDEIGELPLEVQGALLRVLENGSYTPVGEKGSRNCDIRFIFATNRDLAQEVQEGRFSEALYHRINVFTIVVPSLRERMEDVPLLVEHFLQTLPVAQGQQITLDDAAMACLSRYDWPGNVRELRNVIERAVILSENGRIVLRSLPAELVAGGKRSAFIERGSLREMEKTRIIEALKICQENKSLAAKHLGISRKTLYRKLHMYGLTSY